VYKQVLINTKLNTGKRDQETELTGRSRLRRRTTTRRRTGRRHFSKTFTSNSTHMKFGAPVVYGFLYLLTVFLGLACEQIYIF